MANRKHRQARKRCKAARANLEAAAGFSHNSRIADSEPDWGDVDKTRLPRAAHADRGEADKKSTWKYPHHWVEGGGDLDEHGVYTSGTMYLHRGGLAAAWAAAQGARSGEKASQEVIDHLAAHRKALGLEEDAEAAARTELTLQGTVTLTGAEGKEDRPPRIKIVAYNGGVIEPETWPGPVVVHLDGLVYARGKPLPILADHDPQRPLGHGTPAVRESRLEIDGLVSMPRRKALVQDFLESSQAGFPWQASIGARPTTIAYHEEGSSFEANGQTFEAGPEGLYEIQAAALREISILTIGADDGTSVSVAAKAAVNHRKEQSMDFDTWVKAQGKDPAALTDEQRRELKSQFEAEQKASPPAPPADPSPGGQTRLPAGGQGQDNPDDIRARAVAEERRRIADIEVACKDMPAGIESADLKAKAVAGEMTPDALRQALLDRMKAGRAEAPAIVTARGPQDNKTLEAALCLGYGVGDEKDLLASYGEQTLDTAHKYRRVGLRRIGELAAGMAGVELPLSVDDQWIRAAFSTTSLPGIVGNVANKALARAFDAAPQIAPQIARAVSHVNFHTHTVYSLALSGDLEEVGPTGELKHLNISEENWTRQVKTRGALLSISRTDVVNDEIGAFVDNALRLGRKGAVKREKVVFALLNGTGAGASFFTAARGNYQEGADTALGIDSLSAAVHLFRVQTGPDGEIVGIEPAILLVPAALEPTAASLVGQTQAIVVTGATSSRKVEPNVNPWSGRFSPLASGQLDGTSQKAWYLLADPNDVPAVEIAYLNGQQQPTIEYFGLDQDASTLGVSWRVYYDFGAALAEYRAGVKSKGEA